MGVGGEGDITIEMCGSSRKFLDGSGTQINDFMIFELMACIGLVSSSLESVVAASLDAHLPVLSTPWGCFNCEQYLRLSGKPAGRNYISRTSGFSSQSGMTDCGENNR
jgi:hypothetical protein